MKTTVFAMFLRGWDITNQLIFQSKIIKNHACNPNMLFDTQNHRKYKKVTQNGLQWGTQNPSKIMKKSILAPSRVPLSASVPNLITKMVSKDLQMDPKWSPGDPNKT